MANTQKTKNISRTRIRKPRGKLGSRAYGNYSDKMLTLACQVVKSQQITSRDADRQFGITRRTIVNKIKSEHTKSVGHPTVLTADEENQLVKVLQPSGEFGCPLTKLELKLLVHENLKKNSQDHKIKNGIPSDALFD